MENKDELAAVLLDYIVMKKVVAEARFDLEDVITVLRPLIMLEDGAPKSLVIETATKVRDELWRIVYDELEKVIS